MWPRRGRSPSGRCGADRPRRPGAIGPVAYHGQVPLTRRQIYRRRRITVFGGAALVLGSLFYLPMTLLAPLSPAAAQVLPYSAPAATAPTLAWPSYGASAIGAIGYPDVLLTSGDQQPRSIASISKIVTSLVVLEKKPLSVGEEGPTLTMTAKDVDYYHDALKLNGKVEPVRPGLRLTQLQLLKLVLVSSANNYAETLVSWAFGTPAAFLSATRAWLADHGLDHTTMHDPSGLDPRNTSTASDLVALGKLALANPVVKGIVAAKTATIPGIGQIENTNELLGIDGVEGIKTGTLDEAGACLLFAAETKVGTSTVTVVGVILGGADHPSLNRDVRRLLASAEAGFHEVTLAEKGQPFASYTTVWGGQAQAVATGGKKLIVWGDTPVSAAVTTTPVRFDSADAKVGEVTFTVGGTEVSVPLELDAALADPGPLWRLANPFALIG